MSKSLSTITRGIAALALSIAGLAVFAGAANAVTTLPTVTTATSAADGSVTVSWTTPTQPVASQTISGYQIVLASAPTTVLCTVASAGATSCTWTPPTALGGASLSVEALTNNGPTGDATQTTIVAPTTAAPVILGGSYGAVVSNGAVTVSWTPVTQPLGVTLSGYKVYTDAGTLVGTAAATASNLTVANSATGLSSGSTPTFTVKAVSGWGASAASSPSNSARLGTTPTAPTGLVVARTAAGNIKLTFTASSDNGGSTVAYTVLANGLPNSHAGVPAATGTGTSITPASCLPTGCTLTVGTSDGNIAPGSNYVYTVVATNLSGLYSTVVSGNNFANALLAAPASPVTHVTGTSAQLTWSAVTGASAYEVQLYAADGITAVGSPAVVATTQAGGVAATDGYTWISLTRGTTYVASVQAIDGSGVLGLAATATASIAAAANASAPSVSITSTTNSSVTASWTPPTNLGGGSVLAYHVRLVTCTGGTDTTPTGCSLGADSSTTATTKTYTGLIPGQVYAVVVVIENQAGTPTVSIADATALIAQEATPATGNGLSVTTTVGAAPSIKSIVTSGANTTITWLPGSNTPLTPGATTEPGYAVAGWSLIDTSASLPTSGKTICTAAQTATSCTVATSALSNGSVLKITTIDASGYTVTQSAAGTTVTGAAAPTLVTSHQDAVSGVTTVWWTYSYDAQAALNGYTKYYSNKMPVNSFLATALLSNGTTITATATNASPFVTFPYQGTSISIVSITVQAVGALASSAVATAVNAFSAAVPASGPGSVTAPTNPTTLTATSQTYSWAAATTGYAGVSGSTTALPTIYVATLTSAAGQVQTCTTSTTSCTFAGLVVSVKYTFSVTATNYLGANTTAVTSSATTAGVPDAPTISSITGLTATTLTVAIGAPANTGGLPLTGYTVFKGATMALLLTAIATGTTAADSCSGATINGTSTSCTISSLTQGTSYYVAVYAKNTAGTSATYAISSGTTLGVPGAPTAVTAVATKGYVTVSWTAPASTGGSPIVSYTVWTNDGVTSDATTRLCAAPSGVSSPTTCTFAVTANGATNSLIQGVSYKFKVEAINALGSSLYSSYSSYVVAANAPAAPTAVVYGSTTGGLQVAWTPAYDSVTSASGASTTSGSNVITLSAAACTAILMPYNSPIVGTAITSTSFPAGTYITSMSTTMSGTPSSCSAGTITVSNAANATATAALTISLPGYSNGAPVTGYKVTAVGSDGKTLTASTSVVKNDAGLITTSGTNAVVAGTSSSATYTVYVSAINAVGSTQSAVGQAGSAPNAPGTVWVNKTSTGVTVAWTSGGSNDSLPVSYLVVGTGTDGTTTSAAAAGTSATLTGFGLTPGVTYTYSVYATNAAGSSVATTQTAANTVASTLATTAPTVSVIDAAGFGTEQLTVQFSGPVQKTVVNLANAAAAGSSATAHSVDVTDTTLADYTYMSIGDAVSCHTGATCNLTAGSYISAFTAGVSFTITNAAPVVTTAAQAAGSIDLTYIARLPITSFTANAVGSDGSKGSCTTYVVTNGAANDTTSAPSAMCVIADLGDNVAYTITGTYTTSTGVSKTSAAVVASTSVNALAIDYPVVTSMTSTTGMSAVTGALSDTIVINWSPATSTGGDVQLGYFVTLTDTTTTPNTRYVCPTVLTTTSTTCTFTGLSSAGDTFIAEVDATYLASGSIGSASVALVPSSYFVNVNAVTNPTGVFTSTALPSAPSITAMTPVANNTIAVSWLASTDVGSTTTSNGTTITGYTAYAISAAGSVLSCTAAVTASSCNIAGILDQAAYSVFVVANSAVGDARNAFLVAYAASAAYLVPNSSWTSISSVQTFNTGGSTTVWSVPSGVTISSTTSAAPGALTIVWSAPSKASNMPVSSYTVTATNSVSGAVSSCAAVVGTALTCTVTGLANATTYTVSVTATNALGDGPATVLTGIKTMSVSLAGAPTITGVLSTATGLAITWTAPATTGGYPVLGYVVTATDALSTQQYTCPVNSTYGIVLAPAVSCPINGLVVGNTYSISVQAATAAGVGAKATQTATFRGVNPEPVMATFLAVTAKQKSVSALSPAAKTALSGLISSTNDGAQITVTGYGTTKAIALARANAAANYLFNNGAAVHVTINSVISKTVKTALVTVTSN